MDDTGSLGAQVEFCVNLQKSGLCGKRHQVPLAPELQSKVDLGVVWMVAKRSFTRPRPAAAAEAVAPSVTSSGRFTVMSVTTHSQPTA